MPGHEQYFHFLVDCIQEGFHFDVKERSKEEMDSITKVYFYRRFYGVGPKDLPLEEVSEKFRNMLRFPLLNNGLHFFNSLHFSEIDFFSIKNQLGERKEIKLEDLASGVLLKSFFKNCLIIFSDVKISDEILFRGFLNDYQMFEHFNMNFEKLGIDREEHKKRFLAENHEFLNFFEEGFKKARILATRGIKYCDGIERFLSLTSISLKSLLILENEFCKVLDNQDECGLKDCKLCEEVDLMKFFDKFFCFIRGIKSIRIPRYVLLAMIAFKAFRVHLLPFVYSQSEVKTSSLFQEKVKIEFFIRREDASDYCEPLIFFQPLSFVYDLFNTMIAREHTTLFYKDKVGPWQGRHNFKNYGELLPYNYFRKGFSTREPSHTHEWHDWCRGDDHDIGDKDVARKAVGSIIMLTAISIGMLKDHIS